MTNHRAYYSKKFGYNDNYMGPTPKSYRKKGGGFLRDMNRATAKWERTARALQRQQEQAQRQAQRELAIVEQARRREMQDRMAADVDRRNRAIDEVVETLQGLLLATLDVDDTIEFESLKVVGQYPPLALPEHLLVELRAPSEDDFVVRPLNWFAKLLPGAEDRHRRKQDAAGRRYREAVDAHEKALAERAAETQRLTVEYEEGRATFSAEADAHNKNVDALREQYAAGNAQAIADYNSLVLERSRYPEEFPQEFGTTYDSKKKTLHIDYCLPPLSVVPIVRRYKYLKRSGEIREEPRRETEVEMLYRKVLVSIALRSIHEIFEADQASHVQLVEFHGDSELVDKATGSRLKVLVSARRKMFLELNLREVEEMTCFKKLGGRFISR